MPRNILRLLCPSFVCFGDCVAANVEDAVSWMCCGLCHYKLCCAVLRCVVLCWVLLGGSDVWIHEVTFGHKMPQLPQAFLCSPAIWLRYDESNDDVLDPASHEHITEVFVNTDQPTCGQDSSTSASTRRAAIYSSCFFEQQ